MAKILDLPFQNATDFPLCRYLGANGIFETGPELPNGIPGHITIDSGACRLYVNTTTDLDTAGWKRTEIDFGAFPTANGEFWTSFEFRRDWGFDEYVVIGSWAPLINGASGTTYVPIGFRIRNQNLIIQAPKDLSVIGFNNQDLGVAPIGVGKWHKVVAHVNLQPNNTGFREVFLDGVPMFRQYGIPTTYGTADGHYFKLGPYDGEHLLKFEEATLYIRNVSMWSGLGSYQTVMGNVPYIPHRKLQP